MNASSQVDAGEYWLLMPMAFKAEYVDMAVAVITLVLRCYVLHWECHFPRLATSCSWWSGALRCSLVTHGVPPAIGCGWFDDKENVYTGFAALFGLLRLHNS